MDITPESSEQNPEPQDAVAHHTPPEPPKRTLWQRVTSSRFLFFSVMAHFVFGLAAAVWIVQTIQPKRKQNFAAPPSTNPSSRALEHKVQMQKKQQTMSAPAIPKRIVSTGLAKVALPAMPAMPAMKSQISPATMAGAGGVGMGLGVGGMGGGSPGGGGGGVSLFGLRQGGGLTGTFYDLKQDQNGKPTEMALQSFEQGRKFDINAPVNKAYDRALSSLVSNGLSAGSLSSYFRAPQALHLTQLYIPAISADEAPRAFNLGEQVKGRRWIVIYRGSVTAPEAGRYKFAGFGDDVLVVRLDGRVVLDASFAPPTKGRQPPYGKMIFGEAVDISSGFAKTMEVLIGERPGGEFVGYLLLEKEGEQYGKQPNGEPLLPVFKLGRGELPKRGKVAPETAPDTSWSVWRGEAPKSPLPGL